MTPAECSQACQDLDEHDAQWMLGYLLQRDPEVFTEALIRLWKFRAREQKTAMAGAGR